MTRGFYEALQHHLYGGGIQTQDDEIICEHCGCRIPTSDVLAYDEFNATGSALCSDCYSELYEEDIEADD
ncbi:hypothetical protein [Pseudobutyrivibrio sp.]